MISCRCTESLNSDKPSDFHSKSHWLISDNTVSQDKPVAETTVLWCCQTTVITHDNSTNYVVQVRVVVPGHVGVRNVKWLTKITTSEEEAHGPWQRGIGETLHTQADLNTIFMCCIRP